MPCVGHGSFPSLSQRVARGRGCPPCPCTLTRCSSRHGGRGGSSQAELVLQGEVDVVPLRRPIHRLRGHHQVGVLSHVQDLPRRGQETMCQAACIGPKNPGPHLTPSHPTTLGSQGHAGAVVDPAQGGGGAGLSPPCPSGSGWPLAASPGDSCSAPASSAWSTCGTERSW